MDERLGDAVPDEFAVRAPQGADAGTVPAVQEALAAEHAAVWVFDLVRAFLPQDLDADIDHSIDQHRRRRAGCRELLDALGATPVPAEPGYRPPSPVTGADSATRLAIRAGAEAGRAWRGVLERTDDPAVRRFALDALLSAGAESTRWRLVAEETPAPVALVGRA
nr:ferritin-like domain-containing protein [Haloechinothrix aidingensis]